MVDAIEMVVVMVEVIDTVVTVQHHMSAGVQEAFDQDEMTT